MEIDPRNDVCISLCLLYLLFLKYTNVFYVLLFEPIYFIDPTQELVFRDYPCVEFTGKLQKPTDLSSLSHHIPKLSLTQIITLTHSLSAFKFQTSLMILLV